MYPAAQYMYYRVISYLAVVLFVGYQSVFLFFPTGIMRREKSIRSDEFHVRMAIALSPAIFSFFFISMAFHYRIVSSDVAKFLSANGNFAL